MEENNRMKDGTFDPSQFEEKQKWQEGLWNIAGFKPDVIKRSEMSGFHASVVGTLVLMVGLYAAFAWFFFFQTVTDNLLIAGLGGLFFGSFIVLFDRALIASMSSGKSNIVSLLFRFTLAILIGVFLSQPIILKLYEPEIAREASILMDAKTLERKAELEKIYAAEIGGLEAEMLQYESALKTKKNELSLAEADFKQEMDGSSGTGIYGYSTVAKRKEGILNKHQNEWEALQNDIAPKQVAVKNQLQAFQDKITEEVATYRQEHDKVGTLIQVAALESLMEKDASGALRNRAMLLAIILTLIELSALIAKLFLPTRSYKSMSRYIDEREIAQSELSKDIALNQWKHFHEQTLATDRAIVEQFFEDAQAIKREKMGALLEEWKKDGEETYTSLWQRFKKGYLMK